MRKIKNIIFDLGGVFLHVDYLKTQEAFIQAGVTNFDQLYTQQHASPLFELLETGKITPEEFYDLFREISGTQLSNEQIRTAWNAILGEFYMDALEWLTVKNKQYNVYLFSNTNKIHKDAFERIYREQTGLENFEDNFIRSYYSHELGLRKPYPSSFRAIIDELQLDAAETLFIDDSLKNVEGAIEAGLQGIHLELPGTVTMLKL